MGKIIMVIEKSKDHYGAYSENCDGIYAAGKNVEAVKADTFEAIRLLKNNLPESRWPEQIKGDFEIEWKMEVPSFLEYYSSFMSLAGMEKMTGSPRTKAAFAKQYGKRGKEVMYATAWKQYNKKAGKD